MTKPAEYDLVPWFVVRMAGFPIELVRALRTAEIAARVDELLGASEATTTAAARLAAAADAAGFGKLAKAARARRVVDPSAMNGGLEPLTREYAAAFAREADLRVAVDGAFQRSFEESRRRLWDIAADERFREMLLLSGHEELAERREDLTPRRKKLRQREQTLASYLQRVTTKNETISFFGPTAWGRVDDDHAAPATVVFEEPARLERCAYLERWVCDALFARMIADGDAAPLLAVEAADDLELEGTNAVLHATGRSVAVSAEEAAVLVSALDGPALGAPMNIVAGLVERGLLVRRLPNSSDPLAALRALVATWPAGEARARWGSALDALDARRAALVAAEGLDARRRALEALSAALRELGVSDRRESSALYASRLPVNEDCRRAVDEAVVGAPLVDRLTRDLAPWYELWRDIAGAYARRLLAALEPVWRSAATSGPPSLPTFLRAADAAGLPLGRTGGIGIPRELEPEIQRAWADQLGSRASEAEVVLDEDDLAFIRRRFDVRRLRAFDWPAPDVQLCASDPAELRDGRFVAVLAEIHPSFVLWAHCFFWSCPDPAGFAEACRPAGVAPALEFAPVAHGRGTHTFRHAPRWLGGFVFTGPMRSAGQPAIRSARIDVCLEDDDLVARERATGRKLGSLIDTWLVAASTHRLELVGSGAHSPRLRVGRVIVQRRAWLVDIDAEARRRLDGAFGLPQLELLRDLRRRHQLPEEVFVRPVLASRTAEHKDLKPLFVDFRSPLLCELLAGMARQYVRLRFTEALPTSEVGWPGDARGHYSCELRMTTRPAP